MILGRERNSVGVEAVPAHLKANASSVSQVVRQWARQVVLPFMIACCLSAPAAIARQAPVQTLESLLTQAKELEQSENYAGAEKLYQQALASFPDQPEVLKRLGILYQTQLRFPESVELLQKALSRAPGYPEASFFLGMSYFGMGDRDKALASFDNELKTNPGYRRAHYYAAVVLQSMNRKAEAVPHLEALVRQDPKDAKAWYALARLYRSLGLDAFTRLALLDPDSAQVHALKAETYADNDRPADAIREYREVLRRQPDFPGMHFTLGELLYRQPDFPQAEKELRLALQEDPGHPAANYYLADILLTENRPAEAIPFLQAAVDTDPNFAKGYEALGRCYRVSGEPEKALPVLLRAVELDPGSKSTHFQLAQTYAALKDTEKQNHHMAIVARLTVEETERGLKEGEPPKKEGGDKPAPPPRD